MKNLKPVLKTKRPKPVYPKSFSAQKPPYLDLSFSSLNFVVDRLHLTPITKKTTFSAAFLMPF
jgi:hypothetical protein